MSIDRIPPQSLQAEEALLGALMLDRSMLEIVQARVRPDDFYAHVHERIYGVILALAAERAPIDKLAVAERLRAEGALEKVGGLAYLSGLLSAVPTAANAEYYAGIVREKAALRRLIHVGGEIARIGFEGEDDVTAALGKAGEALRATIENDRKSVPVIRSASAVAREPFEPIAYDVATILPADDAPGLIFGPPASLKSWLALALCDAIVRGEPFLGFATRQRPSALYVNLDAGAKTFANRVRSVSDAPGFDFVTLSASEFSADALRRLLAGYPGGFVVLDCLSSIYCPDTRHDPAYSMRAFVDGLRAVFAEFECGGVVIDHPHRPKERGELGDYHGSIQKEAAFRTMWSVVADPPAEDEPGPRRTKIACRKLSEGQPFAPIDVEIEFSGPRVHVSRVHVADPDARASLIEAKILEWAAPQTTAFSRRTVAEKIRGSRTADVRRAFDALVTAGKIVPTGAKRGNGELYRLADPSGSESGTRRDPPDPPGSGAGSRGGSAGSPPVGWDPPLGPTPPDSDDEFDACFAEGEA